MTSKTVYKEIDIDIDLRDFEDEELLAELKTRGIFNIDSVTDDLEEIYQKLRLGLDYNKELSDLIYKTLGRIV